MELVEVFEGFTVQVGVDLVHFGKVLASNLVVVRVAVQPTVFKLAHVDSRGMSVMAGLDWDDNPGSLLEDEMW